MEGHESNYEKRESLEIKEIKKYIDWYRKHYNIKDSDLGIDNRQEPGCIGYPGGEIANLLENQLAMTKFGYGGWKTIMGKGNQDLRKEVLKKIKSYKKNDFNDYNG